MIKLIIKMHKIIEFKIIAKYLHPLNNYYISHAAFCGSIEIVKYLMPLLNPAARDNAAIVFAAEKGYASIVKLLLLSFC